MVIYELCKLSREVGIDYLCLRQRTNYLSENDLLFVTSTKFHYFGAINKLKKRNIQLSLGAIAKIRQRYKANAQNELQQNPARLRTQKRAAANAARELRKTEENRLRRNGLEDAAVNAAPIT